MYTFKNATPQGWQCPVCGRIRNPVQTECPHCNADKDKDKYTYPECLEKFAPIPEIPDFGLPERWRKIIAPTRNNDNDTYTTDHT